eukprot:5016143-Pyramimonas_sp.AAC.1
MSLSRWQGAGWAFCIPSYCSSARTVPVGRREDVPRASCPSNRPPVGWAYPVIFLCSLVGCYCLSLSAQHTLQSSGGT